MANSIASNGIVEAEKNKLRSEITTRLTKTVPKAIRAGTALRFERDRFLFRGDTRRAAYRIVSRMG
jgi:hypothetical protein